MKIRYLSDLHLEITGYVPEDVESVGEDGAHPRAAPEVGVALLRVVGVAVMRDGSIPSSLAWARTHRIAAFASVTVRAHLAHVGSANDDDVPPSRVAQSAIASSTPARSTSTGAPSSPRARHPGFHPESHTT